VITELAEERLERIRRQAHSRCLVCGSSNGQNLHMKFETTPDGGVQALFDCSQNLEGYADMVHGGVVALLLDSAMTNCMFAHGIPAVTAKLTVRFRDPVTANTTATVRAWIERSSSMLYVLNAELVQDEQVKAAAVGRFMEAQVTKEKEPSQ